MTNTLFKNVRDVLVADGYGDRVGESITPEDAAGTLRGGKRSKPLVVVDGEGLWMWPGLVDGHVHFREPGFTEKETIRTGGMAAAAGGVTSVVCEPNTDPPLDSVALVRQLAAKARRESPVNVFFKAAMTTGRRGQEPTNIQALAKEPAVVALSDDGDPVVDPDVMESICRAAAAAGVLLTPHCEDSARAIGAFALGRDPGFRPGEPYTNEDSYIQRDARLAVHSGCRIHFSHVSLEQSIEVISRFKKQADDPTRMTCEVTPHHLLLSSEQLGEGEVPNVNPPLRSPKDRRALREALEAGRVDAIASDHAPHTAADLLAGATGVVGLETTLGLIMTRFVWTGEISAERAVNLLSLSPARIFDLPAGTLKVGSPADLVLIDPSMEWTVNPEEFRSKARNTAFAGWKLRGKAVATYVRGEEVFSVAGFGDRIVGERVLAEGATGERSPSERADE
jgi:dihydroorotase